MLGISLVECINVERNFTSLRRSELIFLYLEGCHIQKEILLYYFRYIECYVFLIFSFLFLKEHPFTKRELEMNKVDLSLLYSSLVSLLRQFELTQLGCVKN